MFWSNRMPRPRASECELLSALALVLLLAWPLQGCKRKAVPRDAEAHRQEHVDNDDSDSAWSNDKLRHPREVDAAWYDVPLVSLAKRRAGLSELTAAHNK